jgi:hypothetical protein
MDFQVVAHLLPQGQSVRNTIVKMGNESLWSREGEMPWQEFAKVYIAELDRVSQAEARIPPKDDESDDEMWKRVERSTRYALREIRNAEGAVVRTQYVAALLEFVAERGVPENIVHALVLHETEPKFGLGGFGEGPLDLRKYTLVAELLLPDGAAVAEDAYRHTNSIDWPWHPANQVRSTSTGDVVVLLAPDMKSCTAHQVRMVGFEEVQFA